MLVWVKETWQGVVIEAVVSAAADNDNDKADYLKCITLLTQVVEY